MAPLDDTDRLIVAALRADGRLSMRALAARVHLSRANTYSRVARLQRDGVIIGFSAVINPARYGYGLSAYVYLDIAQRSWKSVSRQVLSMPEVDHVAFISGEHDILLRVRTHDAASLRDVVLTRLQEMPEVRATQTVLIFEELEPATVSRGRPGSLGHPAGKRPAATNFRPALSLLMAWSEAGRLGVRVRRRSGWIHQELQRGQDGQPDIFRVPR